MVRKILEACPSCGGRLEISEVHCLSCDTQVRARYRPCDFCALTAEQSTFLRLFVTSRGNLSEVEKRLGVSYPTVRAKLDEVIERLAASEGGAGAWLPGAVPNPTRRRSTVPPVETAPDPVPAVSEAGGEKQLERRAILQAVERGEISADEGLSRLSAWGANHEEQD